MKKLLAILLATLIAGCASAPREAALPPPPRLIVFIPIDGFPQRQLVGYRDQYVADGFLRFLDQGAWFSNALQGHSHTTTGPGHAVMLTGAYPHRSGIVGNDWHDRVTWEPTYCVSDPNEKYIGQRTRKLDGTSPRNLKAETVGDVLRGIDERSRVLAVSAKDRGAILPAGWKGTAYMYQTDTGQFASSTYYMSAHPDWVTRFNAARPADRYFHAVWKPLLGDEAYARSVPDGQPWFGAGGRLPKVMGESLALPDSKFYDDLLASPFIDEMVVDFARAAIEAEHLGSDASPDILIVSLKGHDFVNHTWSAESRLSQDHTLRLDRLLAEFFRYLDATIGKENYLAVLTADHGFTPAPEYSAAQGKDARRYSLRNGIAGINARLAERFGPGKWVLGSSADALVVNRALAREKNVDLAQLIEETRRLLLLEPAIEVAYTRTEIMSGSRKGSPFFDRIERSFDPERSGDIPFAIKRYWMISSGSGNAATHGTPHWEDSNVPIAFYGPSWIKPGRNDQPVQTVDIAPTLARILGIRPPAMSEGMVLPVLVPR